MASIVSRSRSISRTVQVIPFLQNPYNNGVLAYHRQYEKDVILIGGIFDASDHVRL
jgi:hypothetical protein